MSGGVLAAAALGVVLLGVERVAGYEIVRFEAEGQVFGSLLSLVHGTGLRGLYPADGWQHPPLVLTQYAPLYFLVCAPVMRLLSLDHSPAVGRAVSLVALAVVLGCLALAARRSGRPWWQVAVLAGGFLLTPALRNPFTAEQTDGLAMMWTMAGWMVLLPDMVPGRGGGGALDAARGASPGTRRLALAGVCFLLALFTKQSFVAAPLAVCLVEAGSGRWRRAAVFAAAMVVAVTAGTEALQVLTGGGYLRNTALSLSVSFGFPSAVQMVRDSEPPVWLPVVLLGLLLAEAKRAPHVAVYVLVSWVLAAVAAFKAGSSSNYLLEPFLALTFLVLITPGSTVAGVRRRALPWALAATLLAAIPGVSHLVSQMRDRPPPIALTGASAGYPLVSAWAFPAVAATGSRPFLNDPYAFSVLARSGAWSPEPLREALARGRIPYVIPDVDLDSEVTAPGESWLDPFWRMPAIVEPLRSRYRLLGRQPEVWIPRTSKAHADGADASPRRAGS